MYVVFPLALIILLFIARKSLWLAMFSAAFFLCIFSPGIKGFFEVLYDTSTDLSIVFLSLAVGVIPVIGGVMEHAGLMDDLLNNLRMKKRMFMGFAPALIGLLPMPGGALLSAPLIDRGGRDVPSDIKVAANVWYRHIFIYIYPLGTLLTVTKMAEINLYKAVLFSVPGFFLLCVLGYIFILRKIHGEIQYKEKFRLMGLLVPLYIVLGAPVLHILLTQLQKKIGLTYNGFSEAALFAGVIFSLCYAVFFIKMKSSVFGRVALKMKPWNYALIIFGMFLFLNVFKASTADDAITGLPLSRVFLLVGVGVVFGLAMGRVSAPIFIIYPIYMEKFHSMNLNAFMLMYLAVFVGYVISPVHPCLAVSLEYFKVSYKDAMRRLAIPAFSALAACFLVGVLIL